MEHQKIINLRDNKTNHPSKFRTRNWVTMMCMTLIAQIVEWKFKITVLKLVYVITVMNIHMNIHMWKELLQLTGEEAVAAASQADGINKKQYSKIVYHLLTA